MIKLKYTNKNFHIYSQHNNFTIKDVPRDGHCLINAVIESLYGQRNENLYTNLKNLISNEILNHANEYIDFSVTTQSDNQISRQQQLINSMQQYIFDKFWNQDLVDLMPVLISKIIKHKLKIFKIINNQLFQEYDISYDYSYHQIIYLKLDFQHYQSITIYETNGPLNTSIDQLSTTIITSNLNQSTYTLDKAKNVCKYCNLTGHSKYTSKNCLKYNDYKQKIHLKSKQQTNNNIFNKNIVSDDLDQPLIQNNAIVSYNKVNFIF
jgi:hypothetical protein